MTPQSILGQRGANLIERIVLEMKCIWRPTSIFDVGIDGEIEICDPATGQASNSVVKVQAKATSHAFVAESDTGFEFVCDKNDLEYWLCGNTPVILIVCRPDTNQAYWVSIRDYFNELSTRKSGKVRFNKKANCFNSSSLAALRDLALSKDAGIYSAPLHQTETLISNLLEVSFFFPSIWVADTDYRTPAALWAQLKSLTTDVGSEWLLAEKRLISFRDLTEFPFDKVTDRGTCEEFDSSEWSESTQPERRWEFTRLLNQCLKALTRSLGLRYHKEYEYFYFPATRGLHTQHVDYQSLHRNASREVFRAYTKKSSPDELGYCRHCAFSGRFLEIDKHWFLEITPTYHFSFDGIREDGFREEHLKGIKRLERNPAVLGQLLMWASFLKRSADDLFQKRYPFLSFGEFITQEIDATLPDAEWYAVEDVLEREELGTRDNNLDLYDV